MKSIEFDENRLNDLQKIAEELFSESDDPRSYGYKRILIRPQINRLKICLNCILPLIAAGCLYVLASRFGISSLVSLLTALIVLLFYLCINAKRIIICAVRIYQRYAPDSIRNKCRFEPSCSQYMILSLQKYGLRKGLKKGIGRLKRCNLTGGGYDFP